MTDTHREKVLELIAAKADGRTADLPTAEPVAPVVDMMAALEASVAAAKAARTTAA